MVVEVRTANCEETPLKAAHHTRPFLMRRPERRHASDAAERRCRCGPAPDSFLSSNDHPRPPRPPRVCEVNGVLCPWLVTIIMF